MDIKLFVLHEGYQKHRCVKLDDGLGVGVCSCGYLDVGTGVPLCRMTSRFLEVGRGKYLKLVKDYLALAKMAAVLDEPPGKHTWDIMADLIERGLKDFYAAY